MVQNKIIVLFNGYSRMLENDVRGEVMQSNCTCTLIKEKSGLNIIIDTMDCWSGPRLIQALTEQGLNPQDIDFCISTHTHPDHLGNNNLFLNAKHIVGWSVSKGDEYFIHDFNNKPYVLSEDIEVISTKGHTLSCISVIVRNSGFDGKTVGIVGDLFEREDDIDNPGLWKDVGSESVEDQFQNRQKIVDMVDIIVPGHGPKFDVSIEIRDKIRNQNERKKLNTIQTV